MKYRLGSEAKKYHRIDRPIACGNYSGEQMVIWSLLHIYINKFIFRCAGLSNSTIKVERTSSFFRWAPGLCHNKDMTWLPATLD